MERKSLMLNLVGLIIAVTAPYVILLTGQTKSHLCSRSSTRLYVSTNHQQPTPRTKNSVDLEFCYQDAYKSCGLQLLAEKGYWSSLPTKVVTHGRMSCIACQSESYRPHPKGSDTSNDGDLAEQR